MSKHEIKVALIGNPNVGKSSIFNLLTGMNQHVGNDQCPNIRPTRYL